jgi:hypothetical protein
MRNAGPLLLLFKRPTPRPSPRPFTPQIRPFAAKSLTPVPYYVIVELQSQNNRIHKGTAAGIAWYPPLQYGGVFLL